MARKRLLLGEYRRVSDVGDREDRLRSPDFQRSAIAADGERDGYDVKQYDAELDVSGSKRERPTLDAILADFDAGLIDGLAVAKLDRISRLAPRERLELFERIEGRGGVIKSASESLDVSTPEGRFARDVFLGIARMQWEQYRQNWTTAKANAIAEGRAIKATANYGYELGADGGLEPVEPDASIVQELFELRAAGGSWAALLELFETATGRSSSRQTMSSMIRNRVYVGDLEYGRTTATRLEHRGAHTAIVSDELFAAAQAATAARAGAKVNRTGRAKALLAGIATCAGCGRPLQRDPRGKGHYAYRCSSTARHCSARAMIPCGELDAFVLEQTLAWAGPAADELIELEVELGARGDRVVAEHRLVEAEAALVAYETDVERELEIGRAAYDAGRKARVALVARRRAELAELGDASEVELVRGTLRTVLADDVEYDVDERRQLLAVAITGLVVRRTPRRGAPACERATVTFAAPPPASGSAGVGGEHAPELLEQTTARV